jgi:plastocyanin
MRSRLSRALTLAVLPAVGALALAGCGDEGGAGSTPSSPAPATSGPPTTVMPTASTPATPATPPKNATPSNTTDPSGDEADVNVEVTIAGGKVSPSGASIKVAAGNTVKIAGTSDVDEELHVHGYDKTLELKAGKPASVTFKADTKGTFEVETHESGKLVAKLVVS